MKAAVLLALLTLPMVTAQATEMLVVDDELGEGPEPLLGLDPLGIYGDPRTDLATVSVEDLGDRYRIRLTTNASREATGDPVSTTLFWYEYSTQAGSIGWTLVATDEVFSLMTRPPGAMGQDAWIAAPDGLLEVMPGSVAWDYEVEVMRGGRHSARTYFQGDTLYNWYAESIVDRGGPNENRVDQAWEIDGIDPVALATAGGLPLDQALQADGAWYVYPLAGKAASMAVAADQAPHAAFWATGENLPAGVHHVELINGEVRRSLVFPGLAPERANTNHEELPLALYMQDGEPHIVFVDANTATAPPDALVHAWREDGAWRTERPLKGGPDVLADARAHLEVVAKGRDVFVAVPRADHQVSVLHHDGAWAEHVLDDVDVVKIDFDGETLHAAALMSGRPLESGAYTWSELTYRSLSKGAWSDPALLAKGVRMEDRAETTHRSAGFDIAIWDQRPCVTWVALDQATLRCGIEDPMVEDLTPMYDVSRFNEPRLDATDDGLALMAGAGWSGWFASRSADGVWWWEADESMLRAVVAQGEGFLARADGWREWGGPGLAVRTLGAQADERDAYFVGSADEMDDIGPYRRPAAATSPPTPAAPTSPQAQVPPMPSPTTSTQDVSAPFGALLVALAWALRRPQP